MVADDFDFGVVENRVAVASAPVIGDRSDFGVTGSGGLGCTSFLPFGLKEMSATFQDGRAAVVPAVKIAGETSEGIEVRQ